MNENVGRGPGPLELRDPMRAPDTGTNAKTDDEPNHETENEAEARRYRSRESMSDELIAGAETPEELYIGLRLLEKQRKESFIPPNLDERYTPPRALSTMYDRAEALSIPIKKMEQKGWIKNYNPETGEAELMDQRFSSLAIKTEISEREDLSIGANGRPFSYQKQEIKYYFGKSEDGVTHESKERKTLEKAYRRGMMELAANDIMGEHFSVRDNTEIRDSLENLTAIMHGGRMPKFKAEHLEEIFNMVSLEELEGAIKVDKELKSLLKTKEADRTPEQLTKIEELSKKRKEIESMHELGDQTEEATLCYLIMLNSGNKQRMVDFMEKPGVKDLIARMAAKNGQSYDEWVVGNVGHIESWTDSSGVLHPGWVEDNDRDLEQTWRDEASDGRRGKLTKWANIAAWGGAPGEFSKELEDDFIENTIGGLCGSVDAAWTAGVMLRATGTFASEGYVALPNGKSLLPLGEGRFISGDDTGKFWAYMFNMKEGKKNRASGLKDLIGRFPDMAMNLFDWAQVVVGKDASGKEIRRSIWDAWLGTAEQLKKDILTGGPVEIKTFDHIEFKNADGNVITTSDMTQIDEENKNHFKVFVKDRKGKIHELLGAKIKIKDKEGKEKEIIAEKVRREEGRRLGDVKFKTLEREFHNTFTIMQWLMGNERGPTGVFIEAMNVEDFKFEDFSLNKLKKIWKYIDIVMNPPVLAKGSVHLYEMGESIRDEVSLIDLGRDEKNEAIGKVNVHMTEFKKTSLIKRRYFMNLMAARIRSAAFMFNILTRTVDIPNPGQAGAPAIPVPQANLVELFIKEAMRDTPDNATEADVLLHYIDDIARLGGVDKDLKKAIEIREKAGKWLTNVVGRVTGKKIV